MMQWGKQRGRWTDGGCEISLEQESLCQLDVSKTTLLFLCQAKQTATAELQEHVRMITVKCTKLVCMCNTTADMGGAPPPTATLQWIKGVHEVKVGL